MNVEKTCFMLFKNRRNIFGPKQAVHVGDEAKPEHLYKHQQLELW
jgi:hypothetical protein